MTLQVIINKIIFASHNGNYYYSYFGVDYAGKIFNYILKNYEKQAQIGDKLKFVVFKRIN